MRTAQEMMNRILSVTHKDECIRLVGMEGARVNPRVVPDRYQDYDISYLVTEIRLCAG